MGAKEQISLLELLLKDRHIVHCWSCSSVNVGELVNLRHGVVEGGEGTADNRDVHHIPKIPHKGPGMEDETLI